MNAIAMNPERRIVPIAGAARLHLNPLRGKILGPADRAVRREHAKNVRDFLRWFSLSNAAETDLLKLIFQNTNWANVGDATGLRGSSTAGNFYISLHTGDPGEGGDQTTSEATYTSYARVAVARSSSGFDVSGNAASNHAAVGFPACTGGSSTCTYFAVGRDTSSTGEIVASGALNASLAVTNGITPSFANAGDLSVTAD